LIEAKAKHNWIVSGGCNGFSIMKVLVQQPEAQCYLRTDDTWTKCIQEARDFNSVADAVLYCSKKNIRFQILLTFEDSRYNLTLGTHVGAASGKRLTHRQF